MTATIASSRPGPVDEVVDQILAERATLTDPQRRAELVLAALGYRLRDADQIDLVVSDDVSGEDCFEVRATLDPAGHVIERHPDDDCLASNLELDDDDNSTWLLPEFFHAVWVADDDRARARINLPNVVCFRARTHDLRQLWTSAPAKGRAL